MNNIPSNPDQFSYYVKPIKNITPCRTISLETVYNFISMDYMRSITRKVRSGDLKKYMVLPFITPSAVFQKRSLDHIISYSGIVSIDLDHVNTDLKYELFEDTFLNPKLIFVSPSNTGLRLFIKVKNSSAEHHDHYFNALSVYLEGKYGFKLNSAGRDISLPCFLCYDPEALYSSLGSVDSETLLNMIPPAPCTDEQLYITPRKELPRYHFLHHSMTTRQHDCKTTRMHDRHSSTSTQSCRRVLLQSCPLRSNRQISTSTHRHISISTRSCRRALVQSYHRPSIFSTN